MSFLLCDICNNLLSNISTPDKLKFKCNKCQILYDPKDNDTMQYEEKNESDISAYKTLILNASKDPVASLDVRQCSNCDNKLVSQIRLTENMQLMNICIKCNKAWLEYE